MPHFKLYLTKDEDELVLDYNNETSELRYENGDIVVPQNEFKEWQPFSKMDAGKRELTKIKIQLGLKCNYSCEYCSQRFVPRNPDDNYKHEDESLKTVEEIDEFIKRFTKVTIGKEIHFELWGGEPFLYWDKFKLVTEKLHARYPHATFSTITNGSLLDQEKVDFLKNHRFFVAISHDAIGQKTRGPDPLEDPEQKKWIYKLRDALVVSKDRTQDKFSINSMVHRDNDSRADIQKWIRNTFGVVHIGEGGTIDAYDEGGLSMSWRTIEEHIAYRRKAFREIMNRSIDQFGILEKKIGSFIQAIKEQRPSSSLYQKCGMDSPNTMAVDLNGNVTTCQNVTVSGKNPGGISHNIGHMDNLEDVDIKTGTHWSDREECPKCPVLHLCQGSCLFLSPDSKEWELSCENAYSDNVVWLAAALYELTGHVLHRIEGDGLPESRQDVFGFKTEKYASA